MAKIVFSVGHPRFLLIFPFVNRQLNSSHRVVHSINENIYFSEKYSFWDIKKKS